MALDNGCKALYGLVFFLFDRQMLSLYSKLLLYGKELGKDYFKKFCVQGPQKEITVHAKE